MQSNSNFQTLAVFVEPENLVVIFTWTFQRPRIVRKNLELKPGVRTFLKSF